MKKNPIKPCKGAIIILDEEQVRKLMALVITEKKNKRI